MGENMTSEFTHCQPTSQEVIDQFRFTAICIRNLGGGEFELVPIGESGNPVLTDLHNPEYPRAKPIVIHGKNTAMAVARQCSRCSEAAHWVLRSWELLED